MQVYHDKQTVKGIIDRTHDGAAVWFDYFALETREKLGETVVRQLLAPHPDDFVVATREDELWGALELRAQGGVGFHPDHLVLQTWDSLNKFVDNTVRIRIANPPLLRPVSAQSVANRGSRYTVGHWWSLYMESLSFLRGPEQALYDLLLEQDNVIRLFNALEPYFFSLIDWYGTTFDVDAIWFGDDFGMQDRMLLSPELFRALFKPYIQRFADKVHSQGMKVFMHTCGDVQSIIGDLAEAGIDVLHPIQPGTMDARAIVKTYGKDITFFAGADVQQVLGTGTPDQVRDHVLRLADIFTNSGGWLLSCANTIMPETPVDNIIALFEAFEQCRTNSATHIKT